MVDKPSGWTSHDVVNRIRRIAGTRKVGHLGTLDPLATGVLPVLVGRATRLARFFSGTGKVYEATIRFGYSTDTYDAEGVPSSPETPVTLDPVWLQENLAEFVGKIQQNPPPISAKKVSGVPAYKLARKHVDFNLEPVEVEISSIDILQCEGAEAEIRVHCGTGTYMRSIAHDLGKALGCGAFLKALRRTASSGFDIRRAVDLQRLAELKEAGRIDEALIPARELLSEYPTELVDSTTASLIRQGRDFRVSPFRAARDSHFVKAVTHEGDLIAIGEAKLPMVYHPVLVF